MSGGRLASLAFHEADNRALPESLTGVADVVIAGWTLCYLKAESPWAGWQEKVGAALDEMERVAKRGATLVVLETLGTGERRGQSKSHYHAWLVKERGFARSELRTDYRFGSVEDGRALATFFFGEKVGRQVAPARGGGASLAETTGLWWKRVEGRSTSTDEAPDAEGATGDECAPAAGDPRGAS